MPDTITTDDKEVKGASTSTDDNGGDSSTSQHDDKGAPKSLAEAVAQSAKKHGVEADSSPEAKSEGRESTETEEEKPSKPVDKEKKDAAADKEPSDDTEKDDKKEEGKAPVKADPLDALAEKFKTNPGITNLVKEYKEAKPLAERGKTVNDFLATRRIPEDTFVGVMNLTDLLVNNPQEFLKQIEPIVNRIKGAVGDGELSAELAQDVKEGNITEAYARKLQRAEATSKLTAQQQQDSAMRNDQASKQTALAGWEANKRGTDPDFQKKYGMVNAKFVELISFEPPKNVADVVALADKAYNFVNENLSAFIPKAPTRKVLKSNGSGHNGEAGEPKSLREVIARTVARHRS